MKSKASTIKELADIISLDGFIERTMKLSLLFYFLDVNIKEFRLSIIKKDEVQVKKSLKEIRRYLSGIQKNG